MDNLPQPDQPEVAPELASAETIPAEQAQLLEIYRMAYPKGKPSIPTRGATLDGIELSCVTANGGATLMISEKARGVTPTRIWSITDGGVFSAVAVVGGKTYMPERDSDCPVFTAELARKTKRALLSAPIRGGISERTSHFSL